MLANKSRADKLLVELFAVFFGSRQAGVEVAHLGGGVKGKVAVMFVGGKYKACPQVFVGFKIIGFGFNKCVALFTLH